MNTDRYFILYKPVNMVSQFISSHVVGLLGDINFNFPAGTHAIGRLDKDSEGLLLLTTNKKITKLLFHGSEPHVRKYLVQVINDISPETIDKLSKGVAISAVRGEKYVTSPCSVEKVEKPYYIEDLKAKTIHPNVKHSWITISLTEGKFHQVRKMVAAVNHKCLRLIRISIEGIELEGMAPGEVREVSEAYFFENLRL